MRKKGEKKREEERSSHLNDTTIISAISMTCCVESGSRNGKGKRNKEEKGKEPKSLEQLATAYSAILIGGFSMTSLTDSHRRKKGKEERKRNHALRRGFYPEVRREKRKDLLSTLAVFNARYQHKGEGEGGGEERG